MQVIIEPNELTKQHAARLLAADSEMLHRYEDESGALPRCIYCAGVGMYRDFAEECPALLRAALQLVEPVASAAKTFMEDGSGTTTVNGRVWWVGDCYAGGLLSSAVMSYLKAIHPSASGGDNSAPAEGSAQPSD